MSADLSNGDAQDAATDILPSLSVLATFQQGIASMLADRIALHLKPGARIERNGGNTTDVHIAADITIEAGQQFLTVKSDGPPISLWITHEPDWIQPDDARLWRFLSACERAEARPLIVARKIAVATFPLLKVLCCQGIQYYSTFVADEMIGEAQAIRERVGWSHVRSIDDFPNIPAATQLLDAIVRLVSHTETSHARQAIEDGLRRGFANEITADLLLGWWQDSELELPRGMVQTLERWVSWEQPDR